MSKSRRMSHNPARLPYKWINPNINEVSSWASHGLGLTSPKLSSPTTRSDSRILRGYYGAEEFEVPAHFTLKAQDPGRGDLLPRTHNENPKKAQGCGRGRSHAQHLTRHLKKKDEFNARTRQVIKLPIL